MCMSYNNANNLKYIPPGKINFGNSNENCKTFLSARVAKMHTLHIGKQFKVSEALVCAQRWPHNCALKNSLGLSSDSIAFLPK